jgi:hypothetical protein
MTFIFLATMALFTSLAYATFADVVINLVMWADASGDILANQNSVTFTIPAPSAYQCFYRVHRVN